MTHYVAFHDESSDAYWLRKTVAGVETNLGSYGVVEAHGDVLKIGASGSTITAYYNGIQRIQVTDTAITSGKHVGWGGYDAYAVRFDNWSGGDILDDLLWTEKPLADGSVYPLFLEGEVVGGSVVPLTGYPAVNSGVLPSEITGLWGWWDATSLTLNDNDPVAVWPDSSGFGRDAAQSDSGQRPVYAAAGINSHPSVLFSSDRLTCAEFPEGSEVTIFAVTDPTDALTYNDVFSSRVVFGSHEGGSINFKLPGIRDGHGDGTPWPTVPSVTSAQYSNSGDFWSNELNGTSAGSGSTISSPPTDINSFALGSTPSGGNWWPGHIGEVIVYSRVLSADDRAAVTNYLMTKWGIT
jgi:hypothetical protein